MGPIVYEIYNTSPLIIFTWIKKINCRQLLPSKTLPNLVYSLWSYSWLFPIRFVMYIIVTTVQTGPSRETPGLVIGLCCTKQAGSNEKHIFDIFFYI